MNIPAKTLSAMIGMITGNPSGSAGIFIFGLGFMLVAGNAIYGQKADHPAPLYTTNEEIRSDAVIKPLRVTNAPVLVTHSVLTQPFSVKNIPVPTANPARHKSIAVHSSLVRDVQSSLSAVGLYGGRVDGIYGSETRQSIIDYQQMAGILPDGEASYGLLSNLKSAQAISKLQQRQNQTGSQDAAPTRQRQPRLLVFDTETVSRIQTGLRENFAEEKISVDGLIGKQTRQAIRRFQERFKLSANGELNEETMEKMVSVGIINNI